MHLPAGLIPAGIVDMNTLIFVSQCRTKNTHNLMHAQAGSCTNVKQKHDHGHIVSMLRFGPLVFFNLLPFFNAYDACALNCKVSVFVPGSHVRFTAEDVPNEDLPDSASVDTVRSGHGRLCPGSKGLSSVPTMLTGPSNGHRDPGDVTNVIDRQPSTYVEQGLETFSTWSA